MSFAGCIKINTIVCEGHTAHKRILSVFFSVVSLLSPLEREAAMKDKVYELFLSFFTHMLYKGRKYLSQDYKRKV